VAKTTDKIPFPFIKFLRKLRILPSTLEHWKTCKPINLKLIEGVRLFCEETIFDSISGDSKLVLEYMKPIRTNLVQVETKDVSSTEEKIPINFLTDEEDKSKKSI